MASDPYVQGLLHESARLREQAIVCIERMDFLLANSRSLREASAALLRRHNAPASPAFLLSLRE